MSNPRFYLMCVVMIAIIIAELVGVYWLSAGSLPPLLLGVDSTVLGWGAAVGLCGLVGTLLWDA